MPVTAPHVNSSVNSTATVAVYARVSSERQARDNTIASQLAALRQRVCDDGCVWTDGLCFVDDGCSGSTLARPALERLRDAAASGLFERLYVLAPDRLARRQGHQFLLIEELRRCGIDIVFLNRAIGASAEDELLLQMQGAFAEYERGKIQERSRRGKRHSAQRGAVSVFSTAPYGYRYVAKTADLPARFEIVADEAAVVRRIFTWVAQTRCSLREVCRRLEKDGVLTRHGKRHWEAATVRGLLHNPAYCGRAAYGKTRIAERKARLRPQRGRPELPRRPGVAQPRPRAEWIEVPVPAIITSELFDAVTEQLCDNRQRQRARQQRTHLLQGLIVCQQCGYSCYVQSASSKSASSKSASSKSASSKMRYGYYRCIGCDRHRGDGQRFCHLPSTPQEPLEQAVWDDVRDLLADPHRLEAEYLRRAQEQAYPSLQRQQLEQRRQRATTAVGRLIEAYTEGLLDKADFEPRVSAAKKRLRDLEAEHKLLLETETRDQDLRTVIDCLERFAQRIHQGLDHADAALRRGLICALVRRVEIGIEAIHVVYRIPLDPFDQGPSGGHLRYWVWRLDTALALSLFTYNPGTERIHYNQPGTLFS